jgi:glucose/arabinose dehydrogenase/cytochrome c553
MQQPMPRRLLLILTTAVLGVALLRMDAARAALPLPDKDDGAIRLPAGFRALVVADGLGPSRFVAVAANGDVYVKTKTGGIVALRDKDGDGRAEVKETFGTGGGTGIAIRDGWLYHSTNSAVYRYRYVPGELVPRGEPETVVSGLPDEKQHAAKAFAFDDAGRLYVEVGSPSNSYGDPDRAKGARGKDPTEFLKTHGGFWRFDPDRKDQTLADGFHFSTGMRHAVNLAWNPVSRAFFVVTMGRDQLNTVDPEHYDEDANAELPAEELHVLREGGSFGWPFTYWDPLRKARMVSPEFGGDKVKRAEPGQYPDPLVAFPAHWAPLQMAFDLGDQFPAKYRGGAFVAFHGSWNRAPREQKGYNVAFVPFDEKGMPRGTYEVFADGFAGVDPIPVAADARYRPSGLAFGPDGSLYVADSEKGRVWRIVYTGEAQGTPSPSAPAPTRATPAPAASGRPASPPAPVEAAGAKLYVQACATCHMVDGSGVPGLQPALKGSAIAAGDPSVLVRVILRGPKAALPGRPAAFANEMPAFDSLSDDEIAAVASYVRRTFGGKAVSITAAQVAAQRAKR